MGIKHLIYEAMAVALLASCAESTGYTSLVDTRIGTESCFVLSYGNTYPATGRPFGMNLWSPQTGDHGDGWKYTYQADEIRAFSQAHQCSPWTRDYAALALFPETGELELLSSLRGARFSHDDETALPQYYSVTFRNGIKTEMAPTERGNHLRFSYPEGQAAYLIIDGGHCVSEMSIDSDGRKVTGCMDMGRRSRKSSTCWFVLTFDEPVKSFGAWHDPNRPAFVRYKTPDMLAAALGDKAELAPAEVMPGADTVKEFNSGIYLEFTAGSTVQVKVASSFISAEQAELNYESELASHSSFEQTLEEGTKVWNDLLGRIAVEGGTLDQRRTFYACLYHASLFPRMFHEYDAAGEPHHFDANTSEVYPGYGFNDIGYWDAFRSQFPLYNLIHPGMQERYVQYMLESYEHDGYLPSWPFFCETFGMIGNHAISLLADAWAKGIRGFDPEKALEAYCKGIDSFGKSVQTSASYGRLGGDAYNALGYVPYPEQLFGTSMTLEYAYDDYCAWTLAKAAGNEELAARFAKSMYNYRNVFDPEVGFMRGRGADGKWTPDFNPIAWGGPFIEGNAMHYNWSVFQDIQGLVNLYGSDEAFCKHLDAVFDMPGIADLGFYDDVYNEMVEMIVAGLGQYEHGNQPIHHMPYLYDYAGEPWKTQFHVRQIMDKVYNPGPKGYPGDEDQGSMSSWYVMSALGFYPVTPGTSQYAIGSPLFEKATISLENGNKFTIVAQNNSAENVYIQSATLNGEPFDRNWIDHAEIMAGGELCFVMGPEPNKERCAAKAASPFSLSKEK